MLKNRMMQFLDIQVTIPFCRGDNLTKFTGAEREVLYFQNTIDLHGTPSPVCFTVCSEQQRLQNSR